MVFNGLQQVARRAHNPKVTGSSPVPATTRVIRNDYSFFLLLTQVYNGIKGVLVEYYLVDITNFLFNN